MSNVSKHIRMQKVTIPACDDHAGSPFNELKVTLPWHCIVCGEPRGEPQAGTSYDGSRWMHVSFWVNPCGHVETYAGIRQWLRAQKEIESHMPQDG